MKPSKARRVRALVPEGTLLLKKHHNRLTAKLRATPRRRPRRNRVAITRRHGNRIGQAGRNVGPVVAPLDYAALPAVDNIFHARAFRHWYQPKPSRPRPTKLNVLGSGTEKKFCVPV